MTDVFNATLTSWKTAALKLSDAELTYDRARAAALAVADGKNEAVRNGQADVATADVRAVRDAARIEERAAKYQLDFLLARAALPSAA
jgi:hypothetical protein